MLFLVLGCQLSSFLGLLLFLEELLLPSGRILWTSDEISDVWVVIGWPRRSLRAPSLILGSLSLLHLCPRVAIPFALTFRLCWTAPIRQGPSLLLWVWRAPAKNLLNITQVQSSESRAQGLDLTDKFLP